MKINLSRKAKEIVDLVAPTVGTVLGGPLGGMAGAIIAQVFGTNDQKVIEDRIIAQDPDALVKLREAENQTKLKLAELHVEIERLNVQDRASARHLAETTSILPQVVLSAVFMIGYFGAFALFLVGDIKPQLGYKDAVLILVGVLTTMMTAIGNFWFGSSSGSQRKTNLLAINKEQQK